MSKNEYKKICFSGVGCVFLGVGVQTMITDSSHVWAGLSMVVLGCIFICFGFLIKSDAKYFFEYLKNAEEYASTKSQIPSSMFWQNNYQTRMGLDLSYEGVSRFISALSNAFACFYKKDIALQISENIFSYLSYQQQVGSTVDEKMEYYKGSYGRILFYLQTFSDHPTNRRQEFEFSDIKDEWKYFIKKKKSGRLIF